MLYKRIWVLGAFATGKTSFIQSISEIDIVGTTIPMEDTHYGNVSKVEYGVDFGRLTINQQLITYFFANPGARLSKSYLNLDMFHREDRFFDGFIYLPQNSHTKNLYAYLDDNDDISLKIIQKLKIPYLIIANKQDREDALSPDQIRRRLDIPESIRIYPCIATDKTIVQRIVLELFKAMPPSDDVQTVIDFLSTPEVLGVDFDTVGKDD